MKHVKTIAIMISLMLVLGSGMAFADSYIVKANFGKRVIEKGTCERVGSITLTPATINDFFVPGQVITVELLANALICRSFEAGYVYQRTTGVTDVNGITGDDLRDANGNLIAAVDYIVKGVAGQDYVTVQIIEQSQNFGESDYEQVIFGHSEDDLTGLGLGESPDDSALCFDLSDTPYVSTDPNLQLVQVSYFSNPFSDFSGDPFVATVKPNRTEIVDCEKLPDGIEIPSEVQDECEIQTRTQCLFQISDDSIGALNGRFNFIVSDTKSNAGLANLLIYEVNENGSLTPLPQLYGDGTGVVDEISRVTQAGALVEAEDYPTDLDELKELYRDTNSVRFTVILPGPGTYRVYGTIYYDCDTEEGEFELSVTGSLTPCGSSINADGLVPVFFTDTPLRNRAVFPYAVGAAGWANGLVITNPNSGEIEVVFNIHEEDGDAYTGSVTVAGYSQVIGLTPGILNAIPNQGVEDEMLGDENYWFEASSLSTFFGFLFIGDGTMAQGYLPHMFWIGETF